MVGIGVGFFAVSNGRDWCVFLRLDMVEIGVFFLRFDKVEIGVFFYGFKR
jgi:hypothetical protein